MIEAAQNEILQEVRAQFALDQKVARANLRSKDVNLKTAAILYNALVELRSALSLYGYGPRADESINRRHVKGVDRKVHAALDFGKKNGMKHLVKNRPTKGS